MLVWKIYKITGPTGKIYIGQTSRTVAYRFKQHCKKPRVKRASVLQNAIVKHGKDQFDVEHIGSCASQTSANLVEIYLIAAYGSLTSDNGYNVRPGAAGYMKAHCVHGHSAIKWGRTNTGDCRGCVAVKMAQRKLQLAIDPEYAAQHREQVRKASAKRVKNGMVSPSPSSSKKRRYPPRKLTDPEKILALAEYKRNWQHKNKAKAREYSRRCAEKKRIASLIVT